METQCDKCSKHIRNNNFKRHYNSCGREIIKQKKERKVRTAPAWNKGLTKEVNEILKQRGKNLQEKYSRGELINSQKGKVFTDERKEKMSKAKIKWLMKHPEKIPYLLNHSSKESYPEKIFRIALEEAKITGWVQEYQNGIYRYDFAFPELKIDIEIDGETHLTNKVRKIDERRDSWTKEQGWKVIRFSSKEIKENNVKCIEVVRSYL